MMWFEHKIDGELSTNIRRDLRLYRREKGKGGHKFSFKDLLSIASTEADGGTPEHAIVTHHQDPAWQHYWHHPQRGWLQQKSYTTRVEACTAVDAFTPPKDNFKTPVRDPENYIHGSVKETPKPESSTQPTGTYLVAGSADRPNVMRVKVSSPWVKQQMADVFERLGYSTNSEVI